jgi:hypothetical protein
MILLTRKANLIEKLLWHYELTNKIGTGWNKRNKSFEGMIKQRQLFFDRTRIGSILQLGCNSYSVSLPTKAFAQMLDCVEALDHVCP